MSARKMTRSTSTKVEKTAVINIPTPEDVVEVVECYEEDESVEESEPEVKKPRAFASTDLIPCVSIAAGELFMTGMKSRINYVWADRGDVTDVEYQDVVAAIRANSSYISKPFFIVQDEDVVKQFPQLSKIYNNLYSIRDLKDVLRQPVATMKATILSLPEGARESIKNIASTQIAQGQLDSVQKIKVLDEIFDTKMMLMTNLYD